MVDNIATSITTANGSTYSRRDHNMVRSGAASGDISGAPTYSGGATPTAYTGFKLATGSLGKGAASSPAGSDIGVEIGAATTPPPPGAPSNLRVIK